MSKLFNRGQMSHVKKNVFDLSHERKLSMNMGQLIPMYLQEVVPGDKFKVSTELLCRLAPMIAPMMHRVNIHTHFFFVPNRLVWDNWQDFITGGPNGNLQPALPKIEINSLNYASFSKGTLLDYFGITPCTQIAPSVATKINALPFRAYQLISNEYFRDQTLTPEFEFSHGDTVAQDEATYLNTIRRRAWEKDYFTSALPWAQRGSEVMIPTSGGTSGLVYKSTSQYVRSEDGAYETREGYPMVRPNDLGHMSHSQDISTAGKYHRMENVDGIENYAGSNGSINDLRKAVRLQEWLEKNARAGARYIEQIIAHFGVRSSDARLQRPEFLGGGINPIVISEVLSTVSTQDLPQGNMSGHGISVGHDNNFTKFFEEHGYVIGIVSVIPRTAYQQGIPKPFLKNDRFDFFWPEFANIGEQPVYDSELYHEYQSGTPDDMSVFGYQSRYAEYKFAPNMVAGDFRDTMNYWHMGRIFDTKPALNNAFVGADPTHRVFAVTDPYEHKLYVQIYNKVTAIRPMPQFGTPQL